MKPVALAVLLVLSVSALARAERLPFRVFTTADGLAGDAVRQLFRDSRGFLWIATSSGLSRFDGQAFRSYDSAEGLPSPQITAVAGRRTARSGSAPPRGWPGSGRWSATARPPSPSIPAPGAASGRRSIFSHVDREGRLWAGVGAGLAVRDHGAWRQVDLPPGMRDVGAMSEDAAGALWFRRPPRGWWCFPARALPGG